MDCTKWLVPNAPGLPFPNFLSGSPCKCAQMHDWSIPHCRMKLTSFRHPAPKISSKKLVKSDTLRYLGSSWLHYSSTFHEQRASGSWPTNKNCTKLWTVRRCSYFAYRYIYIICASMSILLSKQVPSFATQSTIPLSESRKVQRRHMLFSVYL